MSKRIIVLLTSVLSLSILACIYVSLNGIRDSAIKIYAFVDDPTGITTKSKIEFRGVEIGSVTNIDLINNEVLIELSINEEIKVKIEAIFYATHRSLSGDKIIDIKNIDDGAKYFTDGDTIKSLVTSKGLIDSFDPQNNIEPKLKELSGIIGNELLKYSNSTQETSCSVDGLIKISEKIEDELYNLNLKDAFTLISIVCIDNTEYSQFQNELIFKFLERNPKPIKEALEHTNLTEKATDNFYFMLENPISDGFNLNKISLKVSKLVESEERDLILETIRKAIEKY